MLRLYGLERKDNNGNQYPQIYARVFNPTSAVPFHQQVNDFLEPLRQRGLQPIETSSYMNTSICAPRVYHCIQERIMNGFDKRKDMSVQPNDHNIVFIWNINDIAMLSESHIEELNLLRPDINLSSLNNLRERICERVNNLEDSINIRRTVDHIQDALTGETDEMIRAAPIYDALRKLYDNEQTNDIKDKDSIISQDLLDKMGMLEQKDELCEAAKKHQQIFNQRRKYIKKCLELVNRRSAKSRNRNYANIVLCNEGVASGIAQLLLSGLSSTIPIENIYSMFRIADEPNNWYRLKGISERLRHRFGENCHMVHMSSGCIYARLGLFSWPIIANESVKVLYKFQKDLLKRGFL